MPNEFLMPQTIARAALGELAQNLALGALVNRNAGAMFAGTVGDTVTVPRPPLLTGGGVREYTQALRGAGTPIVLDELRESGFAVKLDRHWYKALAVTDEDLSLRIDEFGRRILAPQVAVVAEGIETAVAAELNGLPAGLTAARNGSDLHLTIIEARRLLNTRRIPQGDRYLVVSPDVEALLLRDTENRLVRFDATGSPDALREATVGRLYGFTVVVSNYLAADTAVAFHRDAVYLVTRAPAVPDGAPFAQGVTGGGYAMRWLRDYDPMFLQDRSIVSVFGAARALTEPTNPSDPASPLAVQRAVKITRSAV